MKKKASAFSDEEIEKIVLGALMLEKTAMFNVSDVLLTEDVFSKWEHREIFNVIIGLYNSNNPIDMMTVVNGLRNNGFSEQKGLQAFDIAQLTQKVNSAANIVYHSRILVEFAIRRKLRDLSNSTLAKLENSENDVFEIQNYTESELLKVNELLSSNNTSQVDDLKSEYFDKMQKDIKDHSSGVVNGIQTGISDIDNSLISIKDGEVFVLAARPSMGKTAFLGSVMKYNGQRGKCGLFVSIETDKHKVINRLISDAEDIPLKYLVNRTEHTNRYSEKIGIALDKIGNYNLSIDDSHTVTINNVRNSAYRLDQNLKAQGKELGYILIDYLQLMSGDAKNMNREQEIAKISRGLKKVAKEFNVPIIALAQLSRAVETRGGDKRPMLSDLRESGAIEQDADIIGFLYRPEYYKILENENGEALPKGYTELIIQKNRDGKVGTHLMAFNGDFTRFTNLNNDPFENQETMKPNNNFEDEPNF